jgi:uncharacterized membrane protein YbhN (UPF0104 family)
VARLAGRPARQQIQRSEAQAHPAGPGPRRGQPGSSPRRGWVRAAASLLALGAIVAAIALGRHTLAASLADLGGLDFRWFLLGVASECVSLTAFGLSRRRLLRADGHKATFGSVMAITYAGNALSISVPFAGAQIAAIFSYRQFRRRGLEPALTGWALTVSAITSSSALALVLVVGALAGGAPLATAAGLAGAAVFALPAVTVVLALRYPRARALANRLAATVVRAVQRVARRAVVDPATLEGLLGQVAAIRLGWRGYAEVFGLAVVNWLADCGCLACAIKAAGVAVPWQGLLLAYGAGAAVGSTGVTPGGFGVVEVTLTAALAASGLPASAALTAVLAYRLVNFWMILAGGGIAMAGLSRAAGRIRPYPRTARPAGRSAAGSRGAVSEATSSGTRAGRE